ncbi:MAG: hypothetical protein KBI46_11360, partial [Phycisphaerae bacterium]|nr:hypothetical protein [Phycisphaerae bacterium]
MTAFKERCWMRLLCGMLAVSWAAADITYTFHLDGVDAGIANTIKASVAEAVGLYNQHGSFNKHLHIYYNAGVPTAQANYDGVITFGGSRNTRVALHEMAHTLGTGTVSAWSANLSGGVWQGYYAAKLALAQGSPYADGLHGDGAHFWPWGLNYDSEDGFMERIYHIRTVAALRCDMGILAFALEPRHQTADLGGTAVFSAAAPAAASWRWYKDGVALTDGGRISGAAGPELRIAQAELTDEGSYSCAATGAGETLFSRPARLTIRKLAAYYKFNGNANDSAASNHAAAFGSPLYSAGMAGQAIDLDGTDDYVMLPAGIADTDDITVGGWVNWDGGGNWQRIFDFGTGTAQYLFLTPSSDSNRLRFAIKDSGGEQIVETARLAVGQWVHLAVVLQDTTAVLYVNGRPAAHSGTVTIDPRNFAPNRNYIGKSQFSADPLFNGRIDDFRIYTCALDGADIWNWWGQSADSAPRFAADPLILPDGAQGTAYTGQTLAAWAEDADGDTLTFSKISGPAWLSVSAGGLLSGTPGSTDAGKNTFIVRAADPFGACTDTQLIIYVHGLAAAHYPFEGNALDQSGGGWNGTASGGPAYTSGFFGQAIDLDGIDDYVVLPAGIIRTADFTVAAWVCWDGGGSWQRIFDFGNNTTRYMFLTPSSPSGTLRFAVTAAGNGREERVETAALTPGAWTHVAVSRSGQTLALYVNGTRRAVNPVSTVSPADFAPAYNYIGKSQWPDPLFNGRIDDFRIYNYALSPAEIAVLSSTSIFTDEQFDNDQAAELAPYAGRPLTAFTDYAGGSGALVFAKVSGPAWLFVSPDGTLSGIPADRNIGPNVFTVRVTDALGLSDTAQMTISVANTYSGTQGIADLLGMA